MLLLGRIFGQAGHAHAFSSRLLAFVIAIELLSVQVYYTVDKIGEGTGKDWKGGVGYVTREMATAHIPPPSDDNLVLVCGPPPMYKALSGEKKSPKDQGALISCKTSMGTAAS